MLKNMTDSLFILPSLQSQYKFRIILLYFTVICQQEVYYTLPCNIQVKNFTFLSDNNNGTLQKHLG